MTTREAFTVLGLHGRVTRSEVRAAYLDLVKVWHPDRFAGDERLQRKAEAQLRSVNEAYEWLSSPASQRRSSNQTDPTEHSGHESRPESGSEPPPPPPPPPQPHPPATPSPTQRSETSRVAAMIGWGMLGLFIIIFVVIPNANGPRSAVEPPVASAPADSRSWFEKNAPPTRTAAPTTAAPASELDTLLAEIGAKRVPSGRSPSGSADPVPPRPINGVALSKVQTRGLGQLTISNGTEHDAAVLLDGAGGEQRSVYVRSQSTATVSRIAAGTYNLKFMLGAEWKHDRFSIPSSFNEFDRPVVFTEYETETARHYSRMSVTLNAVVGGKERTSRIPPFTLRLE